MKQTIFVKLFQAKQTSFLCSFSMKNNIEQVSCIIYRLISDFIEVGRDNGRYGLVANTVLKNGKRENTGRKLKQTFFA